MKLQYLTSAYIILKDKNVKILCDPIGLLQKL